MFIAAAAMAFTGCSKDAAEAPAPEVKQRTIRIMAEQDTRTFIDANNKISWSATGESLEVYESVNGGAPVFRTTTGYDLMDGKAQFTVNFDENPNITSSKYGAIHPKEAYVSDNYTLNGLSAVKVSLPQVQNPTAISYDPLGDLLIADPKDKDGGPATALTFAFGRIVAIGKMSISNLDLQAGEYVKAVTFTAPTKTVTGRGKANLATGAPLNDQWGYGISTYNFDNVELRYADNTITNKAFDVWFTCAPFELTTGNTFSIKVVTDKGTYDRTITIADKTLAFKMSELSTFGINMATATFTPAVVDNSIFNVPFGSATANTTYSTAYDMEATGLSAAALTYTFTETSNQIRGNSNKFLAENYEGASSGAFWWATANSSLTISNITLSAGVNYALTFGAKTTQGAATIQAYISKDGGANFFQLAENEVTAALAKEGNMLKTMNFNLNAAVSGPVSIKITITSGSAVIDDVKLVALDTAGDNSYLIDFKIPPMLTTTPDNDGTLTFAANDGTAGSAPEAKTITYTWAGEDCTFAATKATADTWYTMADNGSGTITVTPTEYTATDADRTGTVTLTVTKAGAAVKTSAITINQLKAGGVIEAYKEVTTVVDAGEYIIIGETKGTPYYLPNTAVSARPVSAELPSGVTLSGDEITTPTADMTWTLTASGAGFTVTSTADATVGLGIINNNNGLSVATTYASHIWTFTKKATAYNWAILDTNAISGARYISVYQATNWRTYTTEATNQSGTFRLFKKQ